MIYKVVLFVAAMILFAISVLASCVVLGIDSGLANKLLASLVAVGFFVAWLVVIVALLWEKNG